MTTGLPKVELHVHLDCCLSYEVVAALRPSISFKQYRDEFVAPKKCTNLADFLTRSPSGIALMQTEHELRAVTLDLFQQFRPDNVIYGEIRFAPLLHCERGLRAQEVVRIVDDAVQEGIAKTGVEARIILCTLRHYSTAQSMETVALAERYKGTRVVALDLAADEAGFPIDPHIEAFEFAMQQEIYRTAHAGEARGADSVRETLRNFAPTRIGHGVRSIEDRAIVEHLRDKGIHLEICPSSNIQTNVCDGIADHPVQKLFEAGVSLSINTDARTITDTTLEQEYGLLKKTFGWSKREFERCNTNAIRAAFIPETLKHSLLHRLWNGYSG